MEGELGHVGGMDLGATAYGESELTKPDEVSRFVEETGVDALAVSIGTAHGVYRSLPKLAIDRLKELNEASSVPLVLHGGSGTPDDQIQQSVRHGICKLNIYADCRIAMGRGLQQAAALLTREDPLPGEIFGPIKQGVSRGRREDPTPDGRESCLVARRRGMKLLAISDSYIPLSVMREGLQSLESLGIEVEVRRWEHDTLIELQQANLAIEQDGPDAVELPAELQQNVDDVDLLVTQFAPISRRFIEAATSLKVIGVLRGGTENVDVPFATERGICVMNTPGRNARAVAECHDGHDPVGDSQYRPLSCLPEGRAMAARIPQQRGDSGTVREDGRAGRLWGRGSVGGHYLQAFGSRILAYDPYFEGDPAPATLVDLPTLLAQSDVVSLHARLTEESDHLIGREELALMKPTAMLVNTARSGLVDEQALVQALSRPPDHGRRARRVRHRAARARPPARAARQRDHHAAPGRQHDRCLSQQPQADGRPPATIAPGRRRLADRERDSASGDDGSSKTDDFVSPEPGRTQQ